MAEETLVEIFIPLKRGDGTPVERVWFEALLQELSERFGGATSFARAPGEGLWNEGGEEDRDDIAVIEVMTDELDGAYWSDLKKRLEHELQQEELLARASAMRRL
jgi:hypothetical protein